MPELPEVETVKVFLESNVIQEKTLSVKIENHKLRFRIAKDIPRKLRNSMITKMYGKRFQTGWML